MANEVTADMYLDALAAFDKINAEVKEVASTLTVVAGALKSQTGKFIFSNTSPGLPLAAGLSRDVISVNGSEWKSAEQIQTLLAKWHDARDKMMDAYSKLPKHRRDGVQAPPRAV